MKTKVEKIRDEIMKGGGLKSFTSYDRKTRPINCPMKRMICEELQDLSKEEIHVAFRMGLIGNASIPGSIVADSHTSLIKPSYYYTVNGKQFPQSRKAVNEAIRNMTECPEVIKFKTWNNGKTSKRVIQVKGKSGNFTIS